jgi:hypothetical protein
MVATLEGVVTDKRTGNLIAGATVRAVVMKIPTGGASLLMTDTTFQKPHERAIETKTGDAGTYSLELTPLAYQLEFVAAGYNMKTIPFYPPESAGGLELAFGRMPEKTEYTRKLDVQLERTAKGTLKGQVRVTNLKGLPIGGVMLRFQQATAGSPGRTTVTDENGNFEITLQEGDYDVSPDDPGGQYLKPNVTKVSVEPDRSSTTNLPVEILAVDKAQLGLTKKKNLLGGGAGQVLEGYCKLARADPSKPGSVEYLAGASTPDTRRDPNYGWFEFHDLTPGIYSVSFYRPVGGQDLRKFSTCFTIDKTALDQYRNTPYPIGSSDGRNVLQEIWTSVKQVADQVNTITSMIKPVADIITGFGVKLP